jgi:hypothetical protein
MPTGMAHVLADERRARGAVVDVDRHALAQLERLHVVAVGAQRHLVVGAARDVVEDRLGDPPLGDLAQVFDIGDHRHSGECFTS